MTSMDLPGKLIRTDSSTFGLEHEFERKYKNISKKAPTKILLGHRSYQEELHEKEAYHVVVVDKEKFASSLFKTRMCTTVDKNEKCQHGDNCRFAHSLDELKISNCLFEQRCRFVRMSNDKLINYGEKVCSHKHPHETKENFFSRIGLDRYKSCPKSVDQVAQPQVAPQHSFWQPPPLLFQPMFSQPMFWQPPPPPFPKPFADQQCQTITTAPLKFGGSEVEKLNDEIFIIRVPKELANQALEIAIKSGKVIIQIEIIN